MSPPVVAIFGPTGIGKTGVAIELASLLALRGERAVAVNCDSMQVYRGLEVLSGAPTPAERAALEHRLVGFLPVTEQFSAGRYAELAHAEIDALRAEGTWPLVVGGTGLYLRAALADLDLRPPVDPAIRAEVEGDMAERGAAKLHAELPERFREWVSPNDNKRVARLTGLLRAGQDPAPDTVRGGDLWARELRFPTVLAGLVMDPKALEERVEARVEAMAGSGAAGEASAALEAGASRTARAAIGFDEFLAGDLARVKTLHRRYARRQETWMRRMEGVQAIDRTGLSDRETASRVLALTDRSGDLLKTPLRRQGLT